MFLQKILLFTIVSFFYFNFQAQEIEKADDSKNKSLTLINAFINSTYKGNSITDFSDYNIDTKKVSAYTLALKVLKKKSLKDNTYTDSIYYNNKSIVSTDIQAYRLIKNTIKNKKYILAKTSIYSANYYSKNTFNIKNAPSSIMSIDLKDLGGGLDSTRSGIIYLSETYSKITKNKKYFKEHILAAKTNGINSEIGFNRASNMNFNFYENILTIGDEIVSPIGDNAFNHYNYKLVNSFIAKKNKVHKIKVIPKKEIGSFFNGYIYIVEKDWQLYKVDLFVDGEQIQQPNIDYIKIKQQFYYSKKEKLWLLDRQESLFDFNQFGVRVNGSFISTYDSYNFKKELLKNQFSNEVFSVKDNATNQNDTFWKEHRKLPLTKEEMDEYALKKIIHKKRTSKVYLDSINKKNNGFHFTDLVFDYNYRNLYKKNRLKVSFPFNTMFNTVQGWHSKSMFAYFKDTKHQSYSFKTILNYGFADHQTRITGHVHYQFNEKKNSIIKFSFGRQLTEFNDPYSTSPIFNTITTLLLEENKAKFYDKYFAEIKYQHEIVNGLEIDTKLSYEDRKPVFNHSKFTLFNWKDADYSSNNPLEPTNFNDAVISNHSIYKFSLDATIKFGQKYMTLPNDKINLPTQYPKIDLHYTKGFSVSDKKYNFDFIEARLYQDFKIRNKGFFSYNIKAGRFINKDELSFVDYKHFDITQAHVSIVKDYTNYFALMPTYNFSTNNQFTELHAEHHFEGSLLQKIPYINKLQFKLIIGANTLFTHNNKPYSELNIGINNVGFGKYRFLRIDYVRNFFNGKSNGSIVVRLSL